MFSIPDSFFHTLIAVTIVPLVISKGSDFLAFLLNLISSHWQSLRNYFFPKYSCCIPEIFRETSMVFNNELYRAVMWKCGYLYNQDAITLKNGTPFFLNDFGLCQKNQPFITQFRGDFEFQIKVDQSIIEIVHCKSESPAYFGASTNKRKLKLATSDEMQFKVSIRGTKSAKKGTNKLILNHFLESTHNEYVKSVHKQSLHIINDYNNREILFIDFKTKFSHLLLDSKIKAELKSELDGFFNPKIKNSTLPNRLGLMLCGLPGCGKTSIVKAIANKYKADIFKFESFSPKDKNASQSKYIQDIFQFLGRITNTKVNSIWLFEDIDCMSNLVMGRKENTDNEGLSTFLNALDGISTPDNILVIFTSNRPEVLDSALIRPGRIDRVFHLANTFDNESIQKLCELYVTPTQIESDFCDFVRQNKLSPSMIVSILKTAQRTNRSLIQVSKTILDERYNLQRKTDAKSLDFFELSQNQ